MLRSIGEVAAPLAFGYVSQYIFGGPSSSAGVGGASVRAIADAGTDEEPGGRRAA